ncbi:lipase family protein [Kordiimonas marina]|uniref:lipase family protein n=1 Tax=Kordiimonas marina TaxID=2872312 RepID=UPI001FF2F6CC|nr:lipase family protein [Kordiimonas marina]MCJ9430625.1 lipase family protein [Kordiimonas marina]
MEPYFAHTDLLDPPTRRAAYSDRTSYLMAEMSRLAYFRFEGGSNIKDILEEAKQFVPDEEKWQALAALIENHIPRSGPEEGKRLLDGILQERGFALVDTFDEPATGAQAFLCASDSREMAVLAFRGTEATLKDIKTDVRAQLTTADVNGEKVLIHSGYYDQFSSVKAKIETALQDERVKGKQIFITGHSLGGALAITAVRFLPEDGIGACYTFGSPPVGTKEFDYDIRTPIYRIVNHVDIVPRLPNPVMVYIIRGIGMGVSFLLTPVTGLNARIQESRWYKRLSRLLLDAQQYRQSGYGSYLVGQGNGVRLRYSVSVVDKLRWWARQIPNLFKGDFQLLTDHSIETYSQKLATWAEKRH